MTPAIPSFSTAKWIVPGDYSRYPRVFSTRWAAEILNVWLYLVLGGLIFIGSIGAGSQQGTETGSWGSWGWGAVPGMVMLGIEGWVYSSPNRVTLAVAGVGMGLLGAAATTEIVLYLLYPSLISGIVILGVPAAILGLSFALRAVFLARSLHKLR